MSKPIAILCADIHLSHKPPIWRSAEPDWYEAMKRPLDELTYLQEKYDVPVLCAGDVFDKWNAPAELINFAIDNLPDDFYAIAGQHDLANHNLKEIEKSAFWTLVKSDKIKEMYLLYPLTIDFHPYFYSYGQKIQKNPDKFQAIKICLAHQYIWTKNKNYQTASEDYHLNKFKDVFLSYDVVVTGDNHIPFEATLKSKTSKHKTKVWNCGSLMRRHSDQINYQPRIAILYDNCCLDFYYLDISKDKHIKIADKEIVSDTGLDMSVVIRELEKLGDSELDFEEAVKSYLKNQKIEKQVQSILLKAMGL